MRVSQILRTSDNHGDESRGCYNCLTVQNDDVMNLGKEASVLMHIEINNVSRSPTLKPITKRNVGVPFFTS